MKEKASRQGGGPERLISFLQHSRCFCWGAWALSDLFPFSSSRSVTERTVRVVDKFERKGGERPRPSLTFFLSPLSPSLLFLLPGSRGRTGSRKKPRKPRPRRLPRARSAGHRTPYSRRRTEPPAPLMHSGKDGGCAGREVDFSGGAFWETRDERGRERGWRVSRRASEKKTRELLPFPPLFFSCSSFRFFQHGRPADCDPRDRRRRRRHHPAEPAGQRTAPGW